MPKEIIHVRIGLRDQVVNEYPWISFLVFAGAIWLSLWVFIDIFWPLFGSVRRILVTAVSIPTISHFWVSQGMWGGILSLFFICLIVSVWCGRRYIASPDYVPSSSRSGGLARATVFPGSRASLPAHGAHSAPFASLPRAGSPRSQERSPRIRVAVGPG